MKLPARAILPVLLLLLLAPASPAGEDYEEELKSADAALQKLIDDAIFRGAMWLVRQQHPDGSFSSQIGGGYGMGYTALPTLALLHSGIPRDSEAIQKAFLHLRNLYARGSRLTYSISVTIMALVEYGRVREPGRAEAFRLDEADLAWLEEMVAWLVKVQNGGAWRYPSAGFDNSNSQYALLALKEARSVGIEVPEETFVKALRHFLAQQEKNGRRVPRFVEKGGDGVYAAQRTRAPGYDRTRGWGYVGPTPTTGSMTAAGAAAVAICTDELRGEDTRRLLATGRQSLRDGLAWLGEHFTVLKNPPSGTPWHYYYLYGLERAGVLGRVVYMGKHRWYAEGARFLVDSQSPDGSWAQGFLTGAPAAAGLRADVVNPSFALLFLARATARGLGVATEPPLLDLSAAKDLEDGEFAKLLAAAIAEYDRLNEARAKSRALDFAAMGPRVIPKLLPGLSSADLKTRRRSVTILRAVTGQSFGFDPEAEPGERECAADRWTAWYLEHRQHR